MYVPAAILELERAVLDSIVSRVDRTPGCSPRELDATASGSSVSAPVIVPLREPVPRSYGSSSKVTVWSGSPAR